MAARAPLSTSEARDLLAHVITGVAGGDEADWKRVIGSIERLPTWRYVRFNWQVEPVTGTKAEREPVRKAMEIVRGEHPHIA